MTPLERAEKLAVEYACIGSWDPITLKQAVHTAIIEATNAEVEKRRAAEAECARLQRIIDALSANLSHEPDRIDASKTHCRLKIWNPATQSYWSIAATSEQPFEQGEAKRGS